MMVGLHDLKDLFQPKATPGLRFCDCGADLCMQPLESIESKMLVKPWVMKTQDILCSCPRSDYISELVWTLFRALTQSPANATRYLEMPQYSVNLIRHTVTTGSQKNCNGI